MKALDYKRPDNLDEAYLLLKTHQRAKLVAGGLFLRLQKQTYPLLIDIHDLNLAYIKKEKHVYDIGAMTTLKMIEDSSLPKGLKESVKQISGVGVRNMATIGGSICGRYPFSDLNTILLALDATLVFYNHGEISMRAYYDEGLNEKDILIKVLIHEPTYSGTRYYKKVYTDFSLVNVALTNDTLAVGARPGRTKLIDVSEKIPLEILDEVEFKSDYRASGEYRKALAKALLQDLIDERSCYGS